MNSRTKRCKPSVATKKIALLANPPREGSIQRGSIDDIELQLPLHMLHDSITSDNRRPLVVGALGLNVARLLALVADLLAASRLLGAVTREVAVLAAVVALGAVDTLA